MEVKDELLEEDKHIQDRLYHYFFNMNEGDSEGMEVLDAEYFWDMECRSEAGFVDYSCLSLDEFALELQFGRPGRCCTQRIVCL